VKLKYDVGRQKESSYINRCLMYDSDDTRGDLGVTDVLSVVKGWVLLQNSLHIEIHYWQD